MTANYNLEMKEIWNLYHEKDLPETNFSWQSWNNNSNNDKKEQSREAN
jgi:hypothetical protein